MKHLLKAIAAALLLLLLVMSWDALLQTNLLEVLLNVDFIVADSSLVEDICLHIITGILLYFILLIIYRYLPKLYRAALLTAFLLTAALYYFLSVLAEHYIQINVLGAVGWLTCHLVYFICVNYFIKEHEYDK